MTNEKPLDLLVFNSGLLESILASAGRPATADLATNKSISCFKSKINVRNEFNLEFTGKMTRCSLNQEIRRGGSVSDDDPQILVGFSFSRRHKCSINFEVVVRKGGEGSNVEVQCNCAVANISFLQINLSCRVGYPDMG